MRPIKPGKVQDKMEQHFREKLRNMEMAPPAEMWDRIDAGLDQERKKIKYDHWYYALLILLLPLTVTNLVVNHNIKDYYKDFLSEKKREESFGPKYNLIDAFPSPLRHLNYINQRTISQPLNMNYVEDMPEVYQSPVAAYGRENLSPYIASMNLVADFARNRGILIADDGMRLFQHSRLGENNTLGLALGNEDVIGYVPDKVKTKIEETSGLESDNSVALPTYHKRFFKYAASGNSPLSIPKVKGFYLGAVAGQVLNTFIFANRHSTHSIRPFISMQWEPAYGIRAGYNFNPRFGLETEVVLNSANESYSEMLYGKIPVNGMVRLSHINIPLVAKYKISKVSRLTGQPVCVDFVGGVMYSHLAQADLKVNEYKVYNPNGLFPTNQLGITGGMDYDFFFNKFCFLTLGGRASLVSSVNSIPFTGNGRPSTFGLLLGINASFNVLLPGKKEPVKITHFNPNQTATYGPTNTTIRIDENHQYQVLSQRRPSSISDRPFIREQYHLV